MSFGLEVDGFDTELNQLPLNSLDLDTLDIGFFHFLQCEASSIKL